VIGADTAAAEVRAAEKAGKGMLFASNHTNEVDGPFIRSFLPFGWFDHPMYYVALTSEFYNKKIFDWRRYVYGGWIFKLLGAFPAYRGMKDYQASLTNHIDLLEQQKMVCIFPEGKINRDPDIVLEARGGIAFLAEFTDTDIIPVTIKGTQRIPWGQAFLGKRPLITIEYKSKLNILSLMQNARDRHIPIGADMYKDVARQVMDTVRNP
jgi:1-acyl-sn-glycerol-3-phosphate acyltransferase